MMWRIEVRTHDRPLGYRFLIERFQVTHSSHFRWSYISSKRRGINSITFSDESLTLFFYPPSYEVGDSAFSHLEFAFKHEGINLLIIKKVLEMMPKEDVSAYVKANQTGKYTRLVWFFYEQLLSQKLPLNDLLKGNYVHILDPQMYYTGTGVKFPRYKVDNNLLGSFDFCPILRRTVALKNFEEKELDKVAGRVIKEYSPELLARAMLYLYTKETLSSWEIERERPDRGRLVHFTNLLKRADGGGECTKKMLVDLQKEIVEPRFALNDYRDFQNYVGGESGFGEPILHYIAPRPENVAVLMEGLLASFAKASASGLNPVLVAAIFAFGFVFIHPFEDGNGRIHRFLIHYVLNRLKFAPKEAVFPVSAAILRNTLEYDKALEIFSVPLLEFITQYSISEVGQLSIKEDTFDFYRFIDFTPLAEYLYCKVEETILTDFETELQFLSDYDRIKKQLRDIIDMPDQRLDLFIRFVRQNGGTLSQRKKETYFSMLTDAEIEGMEKIIRGFSN